MLDNTFIICTYTDIICFTYDEGHFITKEINISKYNMKSKIKCGTALKINTKNPNLKAYAESKDESIIIVTGHKNGQVAIWDNYTFTKELANYKVEILNIVNCEYGIVIATDSATLHFWNLSFSENIKNLDLTNFSFKLFNFYVCDLIVADEKLIVTTTEGDVVEIFMTQKQEWNSNNFVHKIKAQRINYITKLSGPLKAIALLEKMDQENEDRIVYVAGQNSMVYAFSLESHELIDIWSVGENITAMDCINFEDGGTVFAVGCANGKIFQRIDWEEHPNNYDCKKMIYDLKFSSDGLYLIAASECAHVYVFSLNSNNYFQLSPKKLRFDNNEIPISLNFTDENKSFVVGTSLRNQYKIELPEPKPKNLLQENELINCTIWNVRYPLHTKTYSTSLAPLIIGGEIKLFVGTSESGYVFFWRDREQLESNCGGFLQGHASQISRLKMTKSQDIFFSMGLNDNTLIEWKVDFVEDYQDAVQPLYQELKVLQSLNQNINDQIITHNEALFRELTYSYFINNISDKFRDAFVLFRGTKESLLNAMDLVEPFEENDYVQKRPPSLSIHLDFVFGFQSYDKRNTLYYIHVYPLKSIYGLKREKSKNLKKEENSNLRKQENKHITQSTFLIPEYKLDHSYKKQKLLPYDDIHDECQRNFVYYTSRVAIIYNPATNKQIFYEGHKYKITCLALHPNKCIVATGEASTRPNIHVWNVINTEPLKILKTYHKNGVIQIAFSRDGSFIISLGMDKNFSLQITNWKTEEIIAIRNSGQEPIFGMIMNPYNKSEFVTCGYQNVTIWEINGRNLLRKTVVKITDSGQVNNPCIVTCIGYISYNLGNLIKSDLICGNNFGDMAIISNGKYITVREQAHSKMLNCLKITEIQESKIIIITSGEDEVIKIWDTKFNLISDIHIRKTGLLGELDPNTAKKNFSAQSIDIFCCKDANSKLYDSSNNSILLFGTRNGDIFEAVISIEYSGQKRKIEKKEKDLEDDEDEEVEESRSSGSDENEEEEAHSLRKKKNIDLSVIEGFKFSYNLYLRSHCSQVFNSGMKNNFFNKKIYYTLHPTESIMASVGEDQNLMLWDIEYNKLITVSNLGMTPTCCRFSPPDGEYLVIGFNNGRFYVLDSKIKKDKFGNFDDKFQMPSLEVVQKHITENKSAVINMEFSSKGEMLAVSYDNARPNKDIFDTKLEKEGSYITVFVNRSYNKTKATKKKESDIYIKYTDIRCPSLNEKHQTESK